MDKQSLREHAKHVRKNIHSNKLSSLICKNIKATKEYQQSQNIMLYYPFGNELNVLELIDDASKSWILPKVVEDDLDIYFYEKGDMLTQNQWRIKEPCLEDKKANLRNLDMVILPGLCADKKGFRLGYGMGYYDRFLRKIPRDCIKILPVVSELFIEEVPKDLWDEPVDIVVTEKEILKINS
jgi:5-formyltetrahydrofolate cyclo-ligase